MSQSLRHYTIRIWLTAFGGGLLCLWSMPILQSKIGIQWIVLPAGILLTGVFFLIGSVLNRLGIRIMQRSLGEAASWERVGMANEARSGYTSALSIFDSFLFSPNARRLNYSRLAPRLARFCLADLQFDPGALEYVTAYLQANPHDREVAESWLELQLKQEDVSQRCHEVAHALGVAWPDERRLGFLLARFYLNSGRTDFDALQAYRFVISRKGRVAHEFALRLSALFLRESRVDEWALKVYLHAIKSGEAHDDVVAGLAACVKWVREVEQTRASLRAARQLLKDYDPEELETMCRRFRPPAPKSIPSPSPESRPKRPQIHLGVFMRALLSQIDKIARHGYALGQRLANRIRIMAHGKRSRNILKWGSVALGFIAVTVLIVNTATHLKPTRNTPQPKPEAPVVVVSDPFTLQVAAYNRLEDAKKYVATLKTKGLDAYWTEAVGASRRWYQVRVSHFPDKASARQYGESLKTKNIIDDYYVANYERP
jgi:hypothetical protein